MAYLRVRVTPSARHDGLEGWQGDILRVRVSAPPERGKANEATLRLLAQALAIDRRLLRIVRGASSRDKLLLIEALDEEEIRERIGVPNVKRIRSG